MVRIGIAMRGERETAEADYLPDHKQEFTSYWTSTPWMGDYG